MALYIKAIQFVHPIRDPLIELLTPICLIPFFDVMCVNVSTLSNTCMMNNAVYCGSLTVSVNQSRIETLLVCMCMDKTKLLLLSEVHVFLQLHQNNARAVAKFCNYFLQLN